MMKSIVSKHHSVSKIHSILHHLKIKQSLLLLSKNVITSKLNEIKASKQYILSRKKQVFKSFIASVDRLRIQANKGERAE